MADTKPTTWEKLCKAKEMLDDGAPYSEVTKTLHISFETLKKNFPGKGWTHQQAVEHGALVRRTDKQIRKAQSVHYVGAK